MSVNWFTALWGVGMSVSQSVHGSVGHWNECQSAGSWLCGALEKHWNECQSTGSWLCGALEKHWNECHLADSRLCGALEKHWNESKLELKNLSIYSRIVALGPLGPI